MANFSIGYGMPYGEFLQTAKFPIPPMVYKYLFGTGLGELVVTLGDGYTEHIMFFPTIADKQRWHPEDGFEIDLPEATYLNIPFHRYCHYMDGNGVEIASPGGDPALVPGVPAVMREWLIRYKVFDLAGVAKLRPVVVEWR